MFKKISRMIKDLLEAAWLLVLVGIIGIVFILASLYIIVVGRWRSLGEFAKEYWPEIYKGLLTLWETRP